MNGGSSLVSAPFGGRGQIVDRRIEQGHTPVDHQLLIGYALAVGSHVVGLGVSLVTDLPSSPMIVWVMGIPGLLVHLSGRNGNGMAARHG